MRNGKPEEYMPLTDNVTGDQVHASNVVMLYAVHTFANTYDQEDEVYHIDLTGSGDAYVFRDGVGTPGALGPHQRESTSDAERRG